MPFEQRKLDVSVSQSRGIYNTYIYETEDETVAQVQTAGYFAASRFAISDPDDWFGGRIDCRCSDGFFSGFIGSDGTASNEISSGTGAGFRLGPPNNLFGATSQDASTTLTVSPAANRAAAEGVRDAYFVANPSNLAEYDAEEALGIVLYFTSGPNTVAQPQTRVGSTWRDNAAIIAIQGMAGSQASFSALSPFSIVAVDGTSQRTPIDSGLTIDQVNDMISTDKSLTVNTGSIGFGDGFSVGTGVNLAVSTDALDGKAYLLQQDFTDSAISKTQQLELVSASNIVVTSVADTALSMPQDFPFVAATANSSTWSFTLQPNGIPAGGATLRVRAWLGTSDAGKRVVNERYALQQSDNGTSVALVIPNPPLVRTGQQLFVRFIDDATDGFTLQGGVQTGTYAGQTLVANTSRVLVVNFVDFLDESDVGQNPSEIPRYTADTDGSNGNPVLPAADGRNLEGVTDNYADSATLSVSSDNTVTLTIGRTGSLADLTGSFRLIAGSNTTLTPNIVDGTITIASTGGGTTPTPTGHDLRHGLDTASAAAAVNFSALTDVPDPSDPQTLATGDTTDGQYYWIFTQNTHPVITITDTVLQQVVYSSTASSGNIFTLFEDAVVESGITYDALRLGPLNARSSEDFELRFS